MRAAKWLAAVVLLLAGTVANGLAEDLLRAGSVWQGSTNGTFKNDKGEAVQYGTDCRLEITKRDGKSFSGKLELDGGKRVLDIQGTVSDDGEIRFTVTKVDDPKRWPTWMVAEFRAAGRLHDKTLSWQSEVRASRGSAEVKLMPSARAAGVARAKARIKDPRVLQVINDLEALFRSWDENKDGYVDAAELARAFRGPDAKPYQPGAGTDSTGPAKEGAGKSDKLRPDQLRKKYPDYDFLLRWDEDRDDRISFDEFIEFGRLVAIHYAGLYRKQDEIEKFRTDLAKEGLTAAQRAQLVAQMNVLNTELTNMQAGFQHQIYLDGLAASAAQSRADWAWYRQFNQRRRR
jgi:hypothetical protein